MPRRKDKNKKYSVEFKLSEVKSYINSKGSLAPLTRLIGYPAMRVMKYALILSVLK